MTLLSHYTTRAGLEGIAQTKAFWATNFLRLNDNSEFFYGWQHIIHSAYKMVMSQIPDAKKQTGCDIESISKSGNTGHRESYLGEWS